MAVGSTKRARNGRPVKLTPGELERLKKMARDTDLDPDQVAYRTGIPASAVRRAFDS